MSTDGAGTNPPLALHEHPSRNTARPAVISAQTRFQWIMVCKAGLLRLGARGERPQFLPRHCSCTQASSQVPPVLGVCLARGVPWVMMTTQ